MALTEMKPTLASSGDNLPLPKLDAFKIVGTSEFLRQIRDAKQGISTGSDSDLSSEGDTFRLPDFLGGTGGGGQEESYCLA